MNMYIGNLSISQFEKITGVYFNEKDKEWLEKHRVNNVNVEDVGGFHIFSTPFTIFCKSNIYDNMVAILNNYDFSESEEFTVWEV